MKNIFIVYGHYNQNSFNAAIKNTFTEAAQKKGHTVDCVDLYKEKFNPVYAGEKPDEVVLDHQKRIDKSDIIVLVVVLSFIELIKISYISYYTFIILKLNFFDSFFY